MKGPEEVGATLETLEASLPRGHPDEFTGRAMTPAEQIRVLLGRKKMQGITDWTRVWPWAVARIRWPHDRDERHEWKRTIQWAEPAYRAAYEGRVWVVDMSALVIFEVRLTAHRASTKHHSELRFP